ncbi:MAG TPA: ATP phosphoribosyltransferase regulatory subunit, partial [Bacillota bacterium]|nr:ATP phosphoribosyltransferase regulatory subunit [Bacillota bacterium]
MEYNLIQKEIDLFRERYKTRRIIEDILIKEGYEYFEPSSFDDIDRFLPLMNTMGQASMVKLIASDSRILVLNPDNTTSIISRIVPLWQEGMKLKLFYSATASRSDRELGISEIRQVGVERLGE